MNYQVRIEDKDGGLYDHWMASRKGAISFSREAVHKGGDHGIVGGVVNEVGVGPVFAVLASW